MNIEKSKVLLVSRHKIDFTLPPILPCVESMKVLGVIINSRLDWNSHVDYLRKKCNQRLHIIWKLRGTVSKEELHEVYVSLIRSVLEFSSPVFVGLNKRLSSTLCKIDKRAHRIIRGWSNDAPHAVFCNCNEETLDLRRICASERLQKC